MQVEAERSTTGTCKTIHLILCVRCPGDRYVAIYMHVNSTRTGRSKKRQMLNFHNLMQMSNVREEKKKHCLVLTSITEKGVKEERKKFDE